MPQTHTEWTPATAETVEAPRDKSASMMLLWIIALIAVAAAGLAWYKQHQDTTQPLVSDTPAPMAAPAQETVTPAEPARRAVESRRETAAAAPRTRSPRPLADNPAPRYPTAALRSGVGGTVMVRAEVDASGTPVNVEVVQRSGDRDLDRAALNAVRKWRFEPALRNGKAVSSTVQVPVDFRPI